MAVLAALAFAGSAQAANGTLDIGWNSCTPTTSNLASVAPGTAAVSLWVSVLGQDQPHKSYEFQIIYGNATNLATPIVPLVPDAWRFDAAGCQGSSQVALEHQAPAKTCPSFMGTITPNFQLKTIAIDGLAGPQYDSRFMHISLANAYPNNGAGNTTEVNPAIRYFLGRIVFNHTFSVNGPTTPPVGSVDCGGLEEPICFAVTSGNYVNLSDQQVPFGLGGIRGATVGSSAGCPATPAKNTTWGQIKGQYR